MYLVSINKYLLYTVGKLLSYRITENYEISNVYVYVREKKKLLLIIINVSRHI